jgi:SAM-dependent methyltransferase
MVSENDEVTRAWNGVLFDKWVRFKHLLTSGLAVHGEALLAFRPPTPGTRVLDLGCGFGDLTQLLGQKLGSAGSAVGVDVAQNFVETSARDAAEAGVKNVEFICRDVQTDDLGGPYAAAYARFGVQFFTSPVAALRNVRKALVPRSTLAFVTWRKREDNQWLHVPELCTRSFIPAEAEAHTEEQPTCGPGPFAMRSTDLMSDQLMAAGYEHIGFERHDAPICIGRDLAEAVDFCIALGPSGEMIRLAGDLGRQKTPEIRAALGEALAPYVTPQGVLGPSSAWLVTAQS